MKDKDDKSPFTGSDTSMNFKCLFWTQFLGAFNDNLFKNILVLIITYSSASFWGMQSTDLVPLAGGIFILPFFLFSPLAGQLSDKLTKSKLFRATKIWEIAVMALAMIGFLLDKPSLLMIVLFLMGTQSAFFGPAKYSVLPEILEPKKLVRGNAYIELGTFLAILLGTIAAGFAVAGQVSPGWISAALLSVAAAGYLFSRGIETPPATTPHLNIDWNPFTSMKPVLKTALAKKPVWNSVLGISWFWFFGASVLSILPAYGKDFLSSGEQVTTLFLAAFTIGMGVGSILCEKLSFERVELGLVPIGSLGITVFLIDLAMIHPNWTAPAEQLLSLSQFIDKPGSWRVLIDFFMIALFGGVFIVPLYAFIQDRSDEKVRSQVIAANNIVNALFMVIAAVFLIALNALGFSLPEVFLILGAVNLAVSIYIYFVVPEFTLRFFAWILTRLLYRVRSSGLDHIPSEGPAILTCNHITFIDWMILGGAIKRPVRFVMHYEFANIPLLRYLMKHAKVIPIAGKKENEKIYDRAFEKIEEALIEGDIVAIFPEGQLTKNGEITSFRPGIKKILERTAVPVIPMALSGLWPSLFSRNPAKKFPGVLWKSVNLDCAPAIEVENLQIETITQELQEKIESMRKRP